MATATSTPSYLSQYLTDYQAGRPDLAQIGPQVTAAKESMKVPSQAGVVHQAEKSLKEAEKSRKRSVLSGMRDVPFPEAHLGRAAIESFKSQTEAAQRRADLYGGALETRAGALGGYIETLRAQAPAAVAGMGESLAAWNKVADRGDQYWKGSVARVAEVTQEFKTELDKHAAKPDSALAHSIQAAGYALAQTVKQQGRGIAERYGMESAEYRDFVDAKRASFGAMVSDLTAKSWDRTQQILNTGLGALGGLMATGMEQVGWAQKNSLDALQAAAAAGDQYRLQTSSYLLALAAAEDTAWSELADWIGGAPVTAVDSTPVFSLLLELDLTAKPQTTATA